MYIQTCVCDSCWRERRDWAGVVGAWGGGGGVGGEREREFIYVLLNMYVTAVGGEVYHYHS